ncbi:gamma carbonic anhydrase family protein [Acidisoma cellulosilytica]|uniref:Gamma carbonic anhydrase family protein n=1 Tax=Acidisoma cellulosilyticum TaxID=2802395 RepID=A0A963Z6S5_9PROT|nr:gamma carbonic anhydrase family protein [Acidisoma cellulosilyticum]MCB8883870.1 gamma carbonic anhydrase family protein [Acidisoma cellulosilyticum]
MRIVLNGIGVETENEDYWIAPNATVIGRVTLCRDASIWWGAVLRGDNERITVGQGSNVQDNAVLHTDPGFPLDIGAHVTVGHQAMLHGCTIGENSLIGIGAVILNGARIGRNCLIGAMAFIGEGKVIPDNALVKGIPGKVVGEVTAEQAARMRAGTDSYIRNWQRYRDHAEIAQD